MTILKVELDSVLGRKIGTLSGGMKQRLTLAQAVLGAPEILILDEPTAGLDPKQRIAVRNYISKISFSKIVIIATHVVSDIEFIAHEVIMLKHGVIADSAPVNKLIEKMSGKVWIVECDESNVQELQKKMRVTSISRNESGQFFLRVLSDFKPNGNAKNAVPMLEDCYLYIFGSICG